MPWIGGYTPFWEEGGISRFDGRNWRVLGNVDCPQITSPRFNDVVTTPDGIMWIASDGGLLRFDPTQEPWCVTRFHAGNSPLRGNQITDLALAPDGTLWVANQSVGGSSAGGLGHYDPSTGSWEFWDTSNGLPWWAGWDWVDYVAVQPDDAGGYTVWFGQESMGLTTYKDGLFVWYGSPTPPDVDPLPTGVPGKGVVDDAGNLLLLTDAGLAIRSPSGEFDIIGGFPAGLTTEVSLVNLLPSGRAILGTFYADVFLWEGGGWSHLGDWGGGSHTYTLAEESGGAIWAGGIGGSSRYENGSWQRYRVTNSGMLDFFPGAVAIAPNGDVAMTANAAPGVGGFDILHPDGTWTNANVATYGLGLPWPYPTDNTSALAYRPNGNLLFAPTNNGLREYDGEILIDRITQAYDIEFIEIAGNGLGWAATDRGVAFRESPGGDWDTQFGTADGLPVGDIAGIEADPADPDRVFIGAQFGIAHTDGVTWNVTPREAFGLTLDTTGHHVTAFDIADDGTWWVGAGLGLHHYDPATGSYSRYDTANTPLPASQVWDVEVAPDGSVWTAVFDIQTWPYPGGIAQLKDGAWRVWSRTASPLPHNQINDVEIRPVDGGYEVWIATASEAVAVISVEGDAGCPADLTGDGTLDFFDVSAFLALFNAQDPAADLSDPLGSFDFFDVSAFLNLYNAGCP